MLRTQFTSGIYEDSLACWGFGIAPIVEKIGYTGVSGIFGEYCMVILLGTHGRLRCYEDELISFNESGVDCDFLFNPTNQKEVYQLEATSFYPNPTLANINITYPAEQPELIQISIFDIHGQLYFLEERWVIPNQEISIDVEHAGVYFVKLESEGRIFTGQFVRS